MNLKKVIIDNSEQNHKIIENKLSEILNNLTYSFYSLLINKKLQKVSSFKKSLIKSK